jgi:organic hydroperoxide reductase OsmC/OhrA
MVMSGSGSWEGQINLLWDGESGGEISINNHPTIKLDMPIEYGGKGRYPCPDEFFLSAIGGCLLTTFLYFKQKVKLHLEALQISVSGKVNLVGPKGYRVTDLTGLIRVKTSKDEKANAKKCIEWAKNYCHITHAITVPIKLSAEITSEEETT